MLEKWLWPASTMGFKRVQLNRGQLMLASEEVDGHKLAAMVLSRVPPQDELSPLYGRGLLRRIALSQGEHALVRTYFHGGLLRKITGRYFFTWPARPFKELVVTESVRERGIPTLDVLAAVVERCWGPVYRGWLVTRELAGAQDLWSALKSVTQFRHRTLLLQAAAMSVRQMHREGVYHADLNLKNILIRQENEEMKAYLIDFDKARLFPREIPAPRAKRNLNRLLRSARKLDPRGRYFSKEDWAAFMAFYERSQ
ncbi:MAG: phosphotransferase [Deltaproteobacteria bacterium]|nr:phosphotransferase [Deltaproteobacteria bacterium]